MTDASCVEFLQWALPQLRMRWPGFRKVRGQVCKRLKRRMQELELSDLSAYHDYLEDHSDEWIALDKMCRISISRLYRDRGEFDLLRDEVLPRLADEAACRRNKTIRIWCAGCASGEETYTLRVIWELAIQSRQPDVALELTATDVDEHMLQRAQLGIYPCSSLKDFPKPWIEQAFRKLGDEFRIVDCFRNSCNWIRQDIRQDQPDGPFDMILCRHLAFTYFDLESQIEILKQLLKRLRSGGVLMTGKQEPLPTSSEDDLIQLRPHSGVYLVGESVPDSHKR